METLFPNECCVAECSPRSDPTKVAARFVVRAFVAAMQIDWSEQQTVTRLFQTILERDIERLLKEHLQVWLEEYVGAFKRELDIDVDFVQAREWGCHAKLSPIIDAVKAKYKPEEGE